MTKLLAIIRLTFNSILRGRLITFIIFMALALAALNLMLATISLNQNERVVINIGLALVSIITVVISVIATTNIVLNEQERGAIFLILPKPVSLTTFIVGKYLGLLAASFIIFSIFSLAIFGLAAIWYRLPLLDITLTLVFGWLEVAVLMSVATLFASFSQPILSTVLTVAVYFVGHSLSLIMAATASSIFIVNMVGKAIYFIMPNLEKFNLREVYVTASSLPYSYYCWGLLYALLYVLICLILSQLAMQKREW